MSILNPSITPAQQAASQVANIIRSAFANLFRSGSQGYSIIWNNPNATPAAIIAALGTDAQELFQLAALNVATITEAAAIGQTTAPSLPTVPSQYVLTFNSDGSANLAQTSSSSSGA